MGHDKIYTDCWLHQMCPTARGHYIEQFCRGIYSKTLQLGAPNPVDAKTELHTNGAHEQCRQGLYDFHSGGNRVEIKATGLRFSHDSRCPRWLFQWKGVKLDAFDELYLCGYTPVELFIWHWKRGNRFSSAGQCTHVTGGDIVIVASRRIKTWEA